MVFARSELQEPIRLQDSQDTARSHFTLFVSLSSLGFDITISGEIIRSYVIEAAVLTGHCDGSQKISVCTWFGLG